MIKKRLAITIIIIIIALIILSMVLLGKKGRITSVNTNSIFEDSENYIDAGNVTERFEHYTSVSRHTAKTDILNSPLFFNGFEVISVGEYKEIELYGENLGVLTDSAGTILVLVNKGNWFEEGKAYEVTGIVKVVNHEGKSIPVVWVENATEYSSEQANVSGSQ